jgi:hypothetical protein
VGHPGGKELLMCGLAFVGILLVLFYTLLVSLLVVYVLWRVGRKIVKRLGAQRRRAGSAAKSFPIDAIGAPQPRRHREEVG